MNQPQPKNNTNNTINDKHIYHTLSQSPSPPLLPFSPIISSRDSNVLLLPALVGVPGFPEFPMFWIGEEGGRHLSPINKKQTSVSKKICINKPTARRKHKFRKIQRKAVNVPYKQRTTGTRYEEEA